MKIALSFIIVLTIFSCAQIKPLTGGEKDIDAPKEIESIPLNGSTEFNNNVITIKFNEYIKLTNIVSQLIVSPLMKTSPEISIRGKKLVIKLNNELAKNTTYSLNFGNAISDITENNILPNYKYVFSTGDYIDSLSYSGTVINAFNQSVKENVYVLLYNQFKDSIPYKELPQYVALTDKEGRFSITNIANGSYKVFAINDINRNYLFDLPNEEIAFLNEQIQLDTSISSNSIYLFKEKSGLQYVVKAKNTAYGKIDIILNQPNKLVGFNGTGKYNEKWMTTHQKEMNKSGDSITIWLKNPTEIENLNFTILDSKEIIDTIEIELNKKLTDSTLFFQSNITSLFDLDKYITLKGSRPIKKNDFTKIELLEDSNNVALEVKMTDASIRNVEIKYPFKENTNYQLFIPANAFEDIYGLKNDTIQLGFKTKKESDYGTINLTLNPNTLEKYIIQLYRNKKRVAENYFLGKQLKQYKYLVPGDYSLKFIIDTNNDGEWTTGNYLKGVQPEKVFFYEKAIKIRANWDNDISWTIKE